MIQEEQLSQGAKTEKKRKINSYDFTFTIKVVYLAQHFSWEILGGISGSVSFFFFFFAILLVGPFFPDW